ncbi:UNKNOWN [Stylonychia lemnae]|uniref:Cyclic nucleotide-binding domain-containing protein n=1 Tax=Stylonychia lemnae TaxID=5949 RepID=A0A077ZSF0_STYLE|nr:UNKNOWN [Stylonychia lemnae]|eukprot:CDW71386.1 UNKNOWN [Stylonychia lemnae]
MTQVRCEPDQKLIMPLIKKIAFFQEHDNIKQEDLNEILVRLKYEFYKAGDIIFSFGILFLNNMCKGDYGDKFYIIFQGSVGVLIPNSKRRKTTVERANQNVSQKFTMAQRLRTIAKQNTLIGMNSSQSNTNPIHKDSSNILFVNSQNSTSRAEQEPTNNNNNVSQNINQHNQNKRYSSIDEKSIEIDDLNDNNNGSPEDEYRSISNQRDLFKNQQNSKDTIETDKSQNRGSFKLDTTSRMLINPSINASSNEISQKNQNSLNKVPISSMKMNFIEPEDPMKDEFYREVATLVAGSSFGELALIQLKPRAATIICKEDCMFATLDRQSYDKVLKKIQQNQLNLNIKFLQSIPFFSKWTKNSVAKFSYYFEKKQFRRNQIVYREGDQCLSVYLVIKGEFEVKKKVKNQSTQRELFDMMEFLPQKKNKQYQQNVKNGRFIKAVNNFKSKKAVESTQNFRIMIIGQGNVIGEEDAIKDRYYSTSVSCFSQEGEVYIISIENFHKFIKATDMETWMMLEKNALQKELNILKIMEAKFKLEEDSMLLKADYPNKYVDQELNYMKEIRETYFVPKADDYIEEILPLVNKQKDYEICDSNIRSRTRDVQKRSSILSNAGFNSPLKDRIKGNKTQLNLLKQKKTIEFNISQISCKPIQQRNSSMTQYQLPQDNQKLLLNNNLSNYDNQLITEGSLFEDSRMLNNSELMMADIYQDSYNKSQLTHLKDKNSISNLDHQTQYQSTISQSHLQARTANTNNREMKMIENPYSMLNLKSAANGSGTQQQHRYQQQCTLSHSILQRRKQSQHMQSRNNMIQKFYSNQSDINNSHLIVPPINQNSHQIQKLQLVNLLKKNQNQSQLMEVSTLKQSQARSKSFSNTTSNGFSQNQNSMRQQYIKKQ